LLAHGLTTAQMVELVRAGLASVSAERVAAGGTTVEIAQVKITDAGRKASRRRNRKFWDPPVLDPQAPRFKGVFPV
jgi:hypothetical protein